MSYSSSGVNYGNEFWGPDESFFSLAFLPRRVNRAKATLRVEQRKHSPGLPQISKGLPTSRII